jgi:hypothetical protein
MTSCRCSETTTNAPANAPLAASDTRLAEVTDRSASSPGGASGERTTRSTSRNAPRSASPPTIKASVRIELRPLSSTRPTP